MPDIGCLSPGAESSHFSQSHQGEPRGPVRRVQGITQRLLGGDVPVAISPSGSQSRCWSAPTLGCCLPQHRAQPPPGQVQRVGVTRGRPHARSTARALAGSAAATLSTGREAPALGSGFPGRVGRRAQATQPPSTAPRRKEAPPALGPGWWPPGLEKEAGPATRQARKSPQLEPGPGRKG